jgi:uncharacterized protein YuzE
MATRCSVRSTESKYLVTGLGEILRGSFGNSRTGWNQRPSRWLHKVCDVRVTYDSSVDAAKIYLVPIGPGEVTDTFACGDDVPGGSIYLDFDKDGRLLGIEVLRASATLPEELLAEAEPL